MATRTADPAAMRAAMFDDGVVVVPDVVDEKLRAMALRAINTELGKGIPKEEAERFANGVQFPSLMMRPAITDLYTKSRAPAVVQSLLGKTHPVGGGQIALRFPGAMCLDHASYIPAPWWNQTWHLDGLTDEAQQWAKKGSVSNFSMLVGVVLADVPAPFMGNLVAFPGSHRMLETVFREQPEALATVADKGEAGLPRNLPLRSAVQVTAKAGDLVLGHYQLAHSIAPNTSAHIRYVVYFRVHAQAHKPDTYRPESMRDIWMDWEGMRPLVEEARRAGTLHVPVVYRTLDPAAAAAAGMGGMSMQSTQRPKTASEWGKVVPLSPEAFTAISNATNPVYDKEKWGDARVGMCQLSDSRPDDFMISLKAAVCVALSDKEFKQPLEYYVAGEAYPRRAIAVAPDIVACHCLLVRILVGAQRHAEAVATMEAALELPTPSEAFAWSEGLIFDATDCAAKALDALNRDDDKGPLVQKVIQLYPKLEQMLGQTGWNRERMQLWTEGRAMMDREPKDWALGQRLFSRLATLEPKHFWTLLQAAACFTYGSGNAPAMLKQGEGYARQTIDIDPASAGGYGILARNLNLQGRHAEVAALATALINCRHEDATKVFVLDSVRCFRIAFQKTNAAPNAFPEVLAALGNAHAAWAGEIEAVSREAACSVM